MDSSYDDMEIKLLKGRTIIVITDCVHLYADLNGFYWVQFVCFVIWLKNNRVWLEAQLCQWLILFYIV